MSCITAFSNGLMTRISYKGWEDADLFLDATLSLDDNLEKMGLTNKFDLVKADFLLSKIHGDCCLTHAVLGLKNMLVNGGKLIIKDLCTHDLAKDAINFFESGNLVSGQVREKILFCQPVDSTGIIYQQNLLSIKRLNFILRNLEIIKYPKTEVVAETPDQIDLGVEDKNISYKKVMETFSQNRPTCVICKRACTKQDHNRSLYSRYCKDHYHEAREMCNKILFDAYTFEVQVTIIKEEKNVLSYCEKECEAKAHHAGIDMGINIDECTILKNAFVEKDAYEIMKMLEDNAKNSMIVFGDHSVSKVDVFDLILKFAEDNFKTMRHDKDGLGYFVVMTDPIL